CASWSARNAGGVVHAKDLLHTLRNQPAKFDVRSVMRPVYFIPETKDLDDLLAEFKRSKTQLAVVKDEYGGTAGMVTIEDLLEEIVGEISDEYDYEEPFVQVIDDNKILINARMYIDDLNEELNLKIPESEEYETVGGFVFDLFGHQPEEGDMVSYENLDFVVEKIDGGRLHSIMLIKTDRPIEPLEDEQNGITSKGKNGTQKG
ncbi:MAG: transporter associated domain-containing protein, partial [Armatimonadota bacterium]